MTVEMISLFLLAVGLAMDAFSVAVTDGMILPEIRLRSALKIAAYFGIFQAVMPCIGYFLGKSFIRYMQNIDHWVAFFLLVIIGLNMIREAVGGKEEEKPDKNPLDHKVLFMLAVATSIDALAAGITLVTMTVPFWICAIVIGAVSFLLSAAGVYIGRKCGNLFGNKAEIAGGVVLILIGAKILIEHLFFLTGT